MRRFLLLGQTGVGKSSFVNATFGVRLASTSDFEACTKTVEYYSRHHTFGDICLIDTPGLAEDTLERDEAYLRLISGQVKLDELFAAIYITRLDDNRLRPDEQRTLSRLTRYLGAKVWRRSWLVMTFAASVPAARRVDVIAKRIEQLEGYLRQIALSDGDGSSFTGFNMRVVIDNVVADWTKEGKPILSILADDNN